MNFRIYLASIEHLAKMPFFYPTSCAQDEILYLLDIHHQQMLQKTSHKLPT